MNQQENGEPTKKELVYVQPVQDYYHPSADDEISLVDLWLILARRKWTIFLITAACLALGVGHAWMKPVVYEYKTGIELARIHGGPESDGLEMLTSRDASIALLEDVIIPSHRDKLFGGEEGGPGVEVSERGAEHALILKSVSRPANSDRVEKLHEAIGDALENEHQPLLENGVEIYTKPFRGRKQMLNKQVETLEEQLNNLSARSDSKHSIADLIDSNQMSSIRKELAETRIDLTDAQSSIEVIREASHPTRISFLASESENPVGTGKALIAALSLVLGLMLGVFAAFFFEFLAKTKDAAKKKE